MFWGTKVLSPLEATWHSAKITIGRVHALAKEAEQELQSNNGRRQQQLTWDDIFLQLKGLLRGNGAYCGLRESDFSAERSTQRRRSTAEAIRAQAGDEQRHFEMKQEQLLDWAERASQDVITAMQETLKELEAQLVAQKTYLAHEEEALARKAQADFSQTIKQVNSGFGKIIWLTGSVGKVWDEVRAADVCRSVKAEQKAVEALLSHWRTQRKTKTEAKRAFRDAQRDISKAWQTAASEIKPRVYQHEYWEDTYHYGIQKFTNRLAKSKARWQSQILGCNCGQQWL